MIQPNTNHSIYAGASVRRMLLVLTCVLYLLFCLAGCANRGIGPQGGPKDSIPPVPMHSTPENGSVNFTGNRIEIAFNEYLQLDNVGQNLLMSPPQQTPPEVKVRGKRVLVTLKDSLRDSTTYSIDFGSAICDYTEKNPLSGYVFSFATGPVIDTLETAGRVFDAENLNPLQGIYAGIHDDLSDTAFTAKPFLRIARTDSTGFFRISNMRAGTYRLYALDEISRDNRLTSGEALAYADGTITAQAPVPADTVAVADSLMPSPVPAPPAELQTLFLFRPQQQRLYLQRTLREEQHRIQLAFSAAPDSLPVLRALRPSELDSAATDTAWVDPMAYTHTSLSAKGDTLTLWLTDSLAIRQDSIFLETRYRRTDSVFNLEWYTDTLQAVYRAPRLTAKAREALERRNRNRRMELKSNARKGFEMYDTLRLFSATPIAAIERDSLHLYECVDSLRKPVAFTLMPYDSLPQSVSLLAKLAAGKQYELQLDSAALHDIYGITHTAVSYKLTLKTPEDYSTLRVKITPFRPEARIQVLNSKDEVVRTLPAQPDGAWFQYLKPDTYYLRLYIDLNGDGRWTTGSWDEHRQPEPVYYFPGKVQTKSNWDFEEEWDYTSVPQTEAKPAELIKASANKKKK